jgi:tRNA pseudouridine55 synthase
VAILALAGEVRDATSIDIDVRCSSGTYVRSLARDIGEAIGCGAHLSALRRRASGPFTLDGAVTLEELQEALGADPAADIVLPIDDGVLGMDAALLCEEGALAISHGQVWRTPEPALSRDRVVRIYTAGGEFAAIGLVSNSGDIRANKVFLRPNSAK